MYIGYYNYVMGGTDEVVEGEWRWRSDNALLSNFTTIYNSATKWVDGKPSYNKSDNYLYWDSIYDRFSDIGGTTDFYYYCEHPRTSDPFNL